MPAKPTVLIADQIAQEGLEIMRNGGLRLIVETGLDRATLARRLGRIDGVVVRSATHIRADVLGAQTTLKVIGRAGIGVDNIDVEAASAYGIAVLNTPDANATTTAELALAHLLSLSRHLQKADASVRAGRWERDKFVGSQVAGKTVGVLGFGTIGRIFASRCRGLEMRVLVHDPYVPAALIDDAGHEAAELAELFGKSDYVSVHIPLSDATRNMLGAKQLALMKPEAYLVHCARGGIVDEKALCAALNAGRLAGAALDVFAEEPASPRNPLLKAKNAVFTPHLGASTREAQKATGVAIARQIVTFFNTGEAVNAVNMPKIPAALLALTRPYLPVAHALGKLMAASCECTESIEVGMHGDAVNVSEPMIVGEALSGFLAGSLSEQVNLVNATRIAERRGLKMGVVKDTAAKGFASLISMNVVCGGKVHSVAGTLLGGAQPRLAYYEGIELEAPLKGPVLLTRHKDKPGVVAALAALLADRRININCMHVSASGEKEAAAFIGLSRELPAKTLAAVHALSAVVGAVALTL